MDQNLPFSVLDGLSARSWSDEIAFSYESTLMTIGRAIAWYSSRIYQEQQAAQPNQEVIDTLLAAQTACVRDQESLRSDDAVEISRLSERYALMLTEFGRL